MRLRVYHTKMYKLIALLAISFAVVSAAADNQKVAELKTKASQTILVIEGLKHDDVKTFYDKVSYKFQQALDTKCEPIIECAVEATSKARSEILNFSFGSELTGLLVDLAAAARKLDYNEVSDKIVSEVEEVLAKTNAQLEHAMTDYNTKFTQVGLSMAADVRKCLENKPKSCQ